MLWVYLSDGQTLHFDLFDADGEKAWREREKDAGFQDLITGVALYHDETLHTLTRPRGFSRIRYRAEITQSKGRPVELRRGRRVFKPSRRS